MRNWTWSQKPKIKVTMAVSKQCDSELIFRWWDSHIGHDTEVFGVNSPEILHVSCLLCLQFSAVCLFFSLKPFLWHVSSDGLPVFLRKISFSCCSCTLCPFCLVECSSRLASLHFWGVSSCCVEDWAKRPPYPSPLLLWASPPLQTLSHLTDTSVGFPGPPLCFLSLSLCSIASSWLPNCWWHKRGGSLHPSFLGGFCLSPVIFRGALNPYFHSCLLSWAWWDISSQ